MHYFCTIAEQGQISRAAKLLHMAQPPLSQRLKELEAELGTPLFERQGRKLLLTEAGTLFYRRARDILRAVETSREEVLRLASQSGPTLRLGLSPTCRSLWLSRFDALQAAFPGHRIGLVVGDSSWLEQLLARGQLDAAFMVPPLEPEHFVVHPLATSRHVALVPRNLLPRAPAVLSLAELARHPLLLLRRSVGVGSYERLLQHFHDEGLTPRVALYSSDVDLLLDLLRQGFAGIAVVPETETREMEGEFLVLGLDVPLPDYRISLVCRQEDAAGPVPARLLEVWQAGGLLAVQAADPLPGVRVGG